MKSMKENSGLLQKVKRKFLRMKSPLEFGGSHRFNSLSVMNIPPEMAHRDAACEQIEALFNNSRFDASSENREKLYARINELLEIALEKTEFIHNASTSAKCHLGSGEMLLYLRLIQRNLVALEEIATSQSIIRQNSSTFEEMLGNPSAAALLPLEKTLFTVEVSLYSAIKEALAAASQQLAQFQIQRRKQFSKSDSERYALAHAEYTRLFAGETQEIPSGSEPQIPEKLPAASPPVYRGDAGNPSRQRTANI